MDEDNNKANSEKEKKPDSILGRIVGFPRRRPSTLKRRPNEEACNGDTSTKNGTTQDSSSGWMRYFNPLNFFPNKKHFTDQEISRVSNITELSPESRKGAMVFADEKKEVVPGETTTRQSHLFDTLDLVRRKTLETIHIVKERSRPMIYFMPTWLLVISGLTCWFVFNSNRTSPKSVAPTLEPGHEPSIAP